MREFKKKIDYIKSAFQAHIYELVKKTPLQKMKKISKNFQNIILTKREDLQLIHSFKIRGAYNMIFNLSKKEKIKGIVTASAGNHAQGVALSASKINVPSLIVMPLRTASIKIDAVRELSAEVLLFGENFDEAKSKAIEISKIKKYVYVPAFDHPDVIAGQATIAIELIQQEPFIDRIFVPVGGGGLISGICVLIKNLIPSIKIIAVETEDTACLSAALKSGYPVDLPFVGSFAEGVAVKKIGDENFRLCKKYIDDIIIVNTKSICVAIKDLFEETRVVAEPSGAVSLAGLKEYIRKKNIKNERLVNILSGANLNFHNLKYISERSEIEENERCLFLVLIPEKKGSLIKLCKILKNYNITDLNYRYKNTYSKYAYIFIGIRTINGTDKCDKIFIQLEEKGYKYFKISYYDINKLNINYMFNGNKLNKVCEKLINFKIPESPGSLLTFLKYIGMQWNISFFCYHFNNFNRADILIAFNNFDNNLIPYEFFNKINYEFQDKTNSGFFDFLNY